MAQREQQTVVRREPHEEGLDPLAIAGWSVLATGAVALGVGGYFGVRVFSLKDEAEPHCDDMNRCDQRGVDLIGEAHDAATASTALIAVGAVMAGTAIVLLVLGATNDSTDVARWSW